MEEKNIVCFTEFDNIDKSARIHLFCNAVASVSYTTAKSCDLFHFNREK
jgi:hypothetical protein